MNMQPSKLRKISREFNKYRYPECKVRIIKNSNEKLVAEFSGTACFSCCFDEHFEDYGLMLKEEGETYRIEGMEKKEGKFIVTYSKVRNDTKA